MNIIGRYTGKIPWALYLKLLSDVSEIASINGIHPDHAAYIYFNGRESQYDDLTVRKHDRVCKRCGRDGWDVRYSGIAREWLCKACWDVEVRERC
ncbi:MAG: hypothetical protein PHS93_08730 [Candidatus Omnitrophica bacterium]|nr:hypothetical protein [Candidatus Omnitrophota bacterium]